MPETHYNVGPGPAPGAVPINPVGPGDWGPGVNAAVGSDKGIPAYVDRSNAHAQSVYFENAVAMSNDPGSSLYQGPIGPPPGAMAETEDDLLLLL
jgi:hypothetical protein